MTDIAERRNDEVKPRFPIEFLGRGRKQIEAGRRFLAESWWGIRPAYDRPEKEFCAPLPPTAQYPLMWRKCGKLLVDGLELTELEMPPYVTAALDRWGQPGLHVDLWEGDGFRVGYGDREHGGDAADFIYADSENLPEEWKEPIAKALEEIRAHWPDKEILFRPSEL